MFVHCFERYQTARAQKGLLCERIRLADATVDRSGIISAREFAVAAVRPRPTCLRRCPPTILRMWLHCYTAQRAASRSRPQVTARRSCCRVLILCVGCARLA